MRVVFADTSFYVALLNKRDQHHGRALDLKGETAACRVVTTDFILIELLRMFAQRGPELRRAAHETADVLRANPNCEVVPATRALLDEARRLYAAREDKDWDVVDCASYIVMHERGLTEALTTDRHFEQMGFSALLRQ